MNRRKRGSVLSGFDVPFPRRLQFFYSFIAVKTRQRRVEIIRSNEFRHKFGEPLRTAASFEEIVDLDTLGTTC